MIHIMAWGIFDVWHKRVAKLPWNAKDEAEKLMAFLAERNPRPDEPYHLLPVKEPLSDFPSQLVLIISNDRTISGYTLDKKTGEKKRWSKTFTDIELTCLVEGRYTLEHKYTVHTHRGQVRVVGYPSFDAFEKHLRKMWPDRYPEILIRIP